MPSAAAVRTLVEEGGITGVHGAAGTPVFHEGNILHGSADNISPWPGIDVMFAYNSVGNTPLDKPFGAAEPRPELLSSTDFTPLDPVGKGSA